MVKPLPNIEQQADTIDEMIRVNHAGEYGAKRIYLGQMSVLKNDPEINQMLEQELLHLKYFDDQIKARKIRPTLLQPLWHIGGFAMGAICAVLGREAAMACTVAVEEVIADHYGKQIEVLSEMSHEQDLLNKINQFRNDELEHHDVGLEHNAREAVGYQIVSQIVKSVTKIAIFMSKKL